MLGDLLPNLNSCQCRLQYVLCATAAKARSYPNLIKSPCREPEADLMEWHVKITASWGFFEPTLGSTDVAKADEKD